MHSRHLVLDKHRLAGDQRRAVDLAAGLTDDLEVGAEGRAISLRNSPKSRSSVASLTAR